MPQTASSPLSPIGHRDDMRVIPPSSPRKRFRTETTRAANIELLGLAVSTVVILGGLLLTSAGQTQSFSTFQADLSNGVLVNLHRLRSPNDITPRHRRQAP